MGGGMSLDDNQDESHESGASRLGNSIFAAICCAPILLIAMCVLLGWNERRAVCDTKALSAGLEVVQKIGCNDGMEANGQLVYLNCDLSKEGLTPLSPGGDFSSLQFVGTGISVKAEMYQCVEHKKDETKKDSVGGGKKTVTTYTYSKEWADHGVSTSSFHKKGSSNYNSNCNADNPSWPSEVPFSTETYAPKVKMGAVTTSLTSSVPLKTPLVGDEFEAPAGWSKSGGLFTNSKWRASGHSGSSNDIGDVRVSLLGNDWNNPQATLVGKNDNGDVQAWTAPDAWLCSGFEVTDLVMGTHSKEELFKKLHAKANSMTWIIRIIAFFIVWCAFSMCFGPLEVAADCIPCIGPMLGDSIECITCCISCLPATACTLGVAGLVWCIMRPMVGIPMMIVWCVVMGGFGYHMATRKKAEKSETGPLNAGLAQNDIYGTAQQYMAGTPFAAPMAQAGYGAPVAQAQPAFVAQPVVAQPRQMQVQVPEGCGAGMLVQVPTPEGNQVQVTIPPGVAPGGIFMAQY